MSVTVKDIQHILFSKHQAEEANLYVYEYGTHVPFLIKRVFNVDANVSCERGAHAHKECNQLLVCLRGTIEVTIDDVSQKEVVVLDSPDKGLLIPAGLWAEQKYSADSLLMVLTDQKYNENDYIRSYDAFEQYRKGG